MKVVMSPTLACGTKRMATWVPSPIEAILMPSPVPHATAGEPRSLDAPGFPHSRYSWPTSFNSCCLEQLCQLLPRVEHARLHCVFGDSDDLGHLFHRFVVVVDQIDDLPMLRRKS